MGSSVTIVSIVLTLSFCLNLMAGKNLLYKRSCPAVSKTYMAEAEDTEDRNGMNRADYANEYRRVQYGGNSGGTIIRGPGDSYSYSHSWGKNHGNGNGNGNGKSGDSWSHSHSWGKNHGNGNGNGNGKSGDFHSHSWGKNHGNGNGK